MGKRARKADGLTRDEKKIAIAAALAKADRLALDDAKEEGKREALREMVTWVEDRYMQDDVEIHSPTGEALREIAGELVDHFRNERLFREFPIEPDDAEEEQPEPEPHHSRGRDDT